MENRWLLIWFRPRAVIRDLIKSDAYEHVGFVVYLALGFILGLRLSTIGFGTLGLVAGPILNIAIFYLYSFVIQRVGNWFGGDASNSQAQIAVAWGTLSLLQVIFIEVLAALSYNLWWGKYISTSAPLILIGLSIGLILWSLTVQWRAIAEAHGFRYRKG